MLGVVNMAPKSSTQEVEAEGLQVQSQPALCSKKRPLSTNKETKLKVTK